MASRPPVISPKQIFSTLAVEIINRDLFITIFNLYMQAQRWTQESLDCKMRQYDIAGADPAQFSSLLYMQMDLLGKFGRELDHDLVIIQKIHSYLQEIRLTAQRYRDQDEQILRYASAARLGLPGEGTVAQPSLLVYMQQDSVEKRYRELESHISYLKEWHAYLQAKELTAKRQYDQDVAAVAARSTGTTVEPTTRPLYLSQAVLLSMKRIRYIKLQNNALSLQIHAYKELIVELYNHVLEDVKCKRQLIVEYLSTESSPGDDSDGGLLSAQLPPPIASVDPEKVLWFRMAWNGYTGTLDAFTNERPWSRGIEELHFHALAHDCTLDQEELVEAIPPGYFRDGILAVAPAPVQAGEYSAINRQEDS